MPLRRACRDALPWLISFSLGVMKTEIVGTRLQDDSGEDFLVISVPWESLKDPDAAANTILAFDIFHFPFVFATRRADGQWIYVGPESLTAICESKIGQNPRWQTIPVSFS